MKRVIILIVTLCLALSFCACGKSTSKKTNDMPFEKLLEHPDYDDIRDLFGEECIEKKNGWVLCYSYNWMDCNGELKICYKPIYERKGKQEIYTGDEFDGAIWEYSGHNLSEIRDKMIAQMDKQFHRTDHYTGGLGADIYKWEDTAGNKLLLSYDSSGSADIITLDLNGATIRYPQNTL